MGVVWKETRRCSFSLSVFDLDGKRVDADHFLHVLAVLGVAFETDGIAFDQELENHVLDEGGDSEPVAAKFPAQSSFVTLFFVL